MSKNRLQAIEERLDTLEELADYKSASKIAGRVNNGGDDYVGSESEFNRIREDAERRGARGGNRSSKSKKGHHMKSGDHFNGNHNDDSDDIDEENQSKSYRYGDEYDYKAKKDKPRRRDFYYLLDGPSELRHDNLVHNSAMIRSGISESMSTKLDIACHFHDAERGEIDDPRAVVVFTGNKRMNAQAEKEARRRLPANGKSLPIVFMSNREDGDDDAYDSESQFENASMHKMPRELIYDSSDVTEPVNSAVASLLKRE